MHNHVLVVIPRPRGEERPIGLYYTLEAAIQDVRGFWLDTDLTLAANLYVCRDERSGEWLAVLTRHRDDPGVCITSFPDATREVHQVSLVVEGGSIRVVIEPLDAPRKLPVLNEFAA